MKRSLQWSLLIALTFAVTVTRLPAANLEEVASIPDQRVTGIAVSKSGRVFVNFPYWEDPHKLSVAELMPDKSLKPYPDAGWNDDNAAKTTPQKHWVCVQSVVVDENDDLWVLDPASPKMAGVVPNGAKLVQFDLKTNQVKRVYSFNQKVAPVKSYLNDVRFDRQRGYAYLTESGVGAVIVLNLQTGEARRALEQHPSVLVDKSFELKVNGKPIREAGGKKPDFHADGIALDAAAEFLYFKPLVSPELYRVRTADLRDASLTSAQVGAKVEDLGRSGAADGLIADQAGNVYLSGIENNQIRRRTPSGQYETVAQDAKISWPDTFAFGPKGQLYFTTSQIQTMAKFNNGKDTRTGPFRVLRINVGGQGATLSRAK